MAIEESLIKFIGRLKVTSLVEAGIQLEPDQARFEHHSQPNTLPISLMQTSAEHGLYFLKTKSF
jgi:hypothetical protein